MAHIHTLPDGRETSTDIADPDNPDLHWHAVDDGATSSDAFGPGHTHTFEGETTSPPIERDSKNMMESKNVNGSVVEVKQVERNGVKVGIVAGYIATWDLDRGQWGVRDQFVKGAFLNSIARHRRDDRPIRLKDHHGRTVGGFPIGGVFEDSKGLFGTGEINLEVQQGREAFALAKQGVLSDFSIGFSSINDTISDDIRTITEAEVWEGSIVDEPMNPEARITEVKTVVPFQDLPLASRDRAWDKDAAISRVRSLTDSEDSPSSDYRRAFLWFDSADSENFGAYKLPIADVINGRLTAIPRAIFAVASVLQGGRGGVDIPEADRDRIIRNVERYYAKMDLDSPFDDGDKQYFVTDDVKNWSVRDLERFLKSTGCMSRDASKVLAGRLVEKHKEPEEDLSELVTELKKLKEAFAK